MSLGSSCQVSYLAAGLARVCPPRERCVFRGALHKRHIFSQYTFNTRAASANSAARPAGCVRSDLWPLSIGARAHTHNLQIAIIICSRVTAVSRRARNLQKRQSCRADDNRLRAGRQRRRQRQRRRLAKTCDSLHLIELFAPIPRRSLLAIGSVAAESD